VATKYPPSEQHNHDGKASTKEGVATKYLVSASRPLMCFGDND
jgi:hypothetical protein